MKFNNKDLHAFISRNNLSELINAWRKICIANIWLSCTEYAISAGLLCWIGLVHMGVSKLQKYQQLIECGKKWHLKYEIMACTFNSPKKVNEIQPNLIKMYQ